MEWFWHLALSFVGLIGLGLGIWLPLIHVDKNKNLQWSDFGIVVLSGALLVSIHGLLAWNWNEALPLLSIFSIFGWMGSAFALWKKRTHLFQSPRKTQVRSFLVFGLLSFMYIFKIGTDPIWSYDARSVWFFAAKILYFNDGFGNSDTWLIPNAHFYHLDYPKLIPILAAHIAKSVGFWNEYLPKLALAVLVIPAISFLLEFKDRPWNTFILILLFLGIPGSHLWTGYMDGYVALYAGLGVLFWIHSQRTRSLRHTAISILSFATLVSLKEEGRYFFVIFFLIALAYSYKFDWRHWLRLNGPLLIAVIPAILWLIVRTKLGMHSDDFLTGGFARLRSRFTFQIVYNNILMNLIFETGISRASLPLFLCLGFAYFRGVRFSELPWLPLIVGLGYALFIVFVYLTTPFDLAYHVYASITRISLPIVMMMVISSIIALTKLPRNGPKT